MKEYRVTSEPFYRSDLEYRHSHGADDGIAIGHTVRVENPTPDRVGDVYAENDATGFASYLNLECLTEVTALPTPTRAEALRQAVEIIGGGAGAVSLIKLADYLQGKDVSA